MAFNLTPPQAMMTTDTARASSIGTLIERDPLLTTMPNVVRIGFCKNWILLPWIFRQLSCVHTNCQVLAVHLLIERNSPASLWEPYINTLPHQYSTVLYFSKQQVR